MKQAEFKFKCESCKELIKKSHYCIAQNATGNDVQYTCKCGEVTLLEADDCGGRG